MSAAVDKATAAWKGAPPDWIVRLAAECDASSQNKVAARIGRSASLVSAVLSNKYLGDMAAVEEVVRGVYFAATVKCPVLGIIASNVCRDWMLKAAVYSNENSQRVRMYRACNTCPRMKKEASA